MLRWLVRVGRRLASDQIKASGGSKPSKKNERHYSSLDDEKVKILRKEASNILKLHEGGPKGGAMVFQINSKDTVKVFLDSLKKIKPNSAIFACDTEVVDLDLKKMGPVGQGKIICASIYAGPLVDLGGGKGVPVWIDNMKHPSAIVELAPFWNSADHKKVFHNVGFDGHILENNEGILLDGLGGDTMHMARMWDAARKYGYGLEQLTKELLMFEKKDLMELFGVNETERAAKAKEAAKEMRLKKKSAAKLSKNVTTLGKLLTEKKKKDKTQSKPQKASSANAFQVADYNLVDDIDIDVGNVDDVKNDDDDDDNDNNDDDDDEDGVDDESRNYSTIKALGMVKDAKGVIKNSNSSDGDGDGGGEGGESEVIDDLPKKKKGKIRYSFPDLREVQENENSRNLWISYSVSDVISGWWLYTVFKQILLMKPCVQYINLQSDAKRKTPLNLFDIYTRYWLPFGKLLLDMERRGIEVDTKRLKQAEEEAMKDLEASRAKFITWASKYSPNVHLMNLKSPKQKQHFLFGGRLEFKTFKALNVDKIVLEGKKKPLKHISFTLTGLQLYDRKKYELTDEDKKLNTFDRKLKLLKEATKTSQANIVKLVGEDPTGSKPKYGEAVKYFESEEEGKEACRALHSLTTMSSISTLTNTFLKPLQTIIDKNSRIHSILNIATETGRLSSRRPNLQNQPSFSKDRYKIRDCFRASNGKMFVVCDYSQLELRIMAHMTKCKSMIDDFKLGGDYHSRTAVSMFDYIKKDIDDGNIYLEWKDKSKKPDKPLLKDKYGEERKLAKILNFSIAYGKTAFGLAADWGKTKREAEEIIQKWYKERQEVLKWQTDVKAIGARTCETRTLIGRYRYLPGFLDAELPRRTPALSAAQRAAINTPIQGGAADVVMAAMNRLDSDPVLKKLGYVLLLQIHDEVILEGPEENAKAALARTVEVMNYPFGEENPLLVDLVVDGKAAKTWYEGK